MAYARADTVRPLGLPAGSIRALLTILITAVVVVQSIRGQVIGVLWLQTLMIVLAHYFTSRRLVDLPPEELERLQDSGVLLREANPLYLPRHSIRAMIMIVFIGLAVYLYEAGRLFEAQSVSLLLTVFSYFLGMISKRVVRWLGRGTREGLGRRWAHVKAGVVLLMVAAAAGAYFLDRPLPPQLQDVTLAMVLFYFGAR